MGERHVERTFVGGAAWNDDRFQCRWGERAALRGRSRYTDSVADLDIAETPELSNLPCGDRRTPHGRAALEHADRGHPSLVIPAELHAIPHAYCSREHTNISDLLPGCTAFDLEHGARNRAIGIAFGSRQQLFDAGDQRIHARAGDC